MPEKLNRQPGISLVEVLLAIAISVAMLAGVFKLMADNQREMRARQVAEHLQAVQQAAADYFMQNRNDILLAIADGEPEPTYCRLGVQKDGNGGVPAVSSRLRTCSFDVSLLRHAGLLPGQFQETNAFGERWLVVVRSVYQEEEPTGHADMLVLATQTEGTYNPRRYNDSLSIMARLGARGGLVPDGMRGPCVFAPEHQRFDACGNGWRVDLRDFLETDQLNQMANTLRLVER